jgi:geranylgeranyl diphosphate synthase type II
MGGKRVRPVLCLMSHELFEELNENAWNTATAIELFHNFTLMHDDIMDAAPLRRGFVTVHEKYNQSTAILSGDVMNIFAYEHLNKVNTNYIHAVIELFNKTSIQICEGQQLDMDFELREIVTMDEYLEMITLKTSVLLAASLKLGAMLGGATDGCSEVLYNFGKTLGIAFQLKDDYLDAFGEIAKTGKQLGGDILVNKKTFLSAKAFEIANEEQKAELLTLLSRTDTEKLTDTLVFFEKLNIKQHLQDEITLYTEKAYELLEKVPVISRRKIHLQAVADMLLKREY